LPWRVRRAKRQEQLFYTMRLQVLVRGWLARRRVRSLKAAQASPDEVAAMQIQRLARGTLARRKHGRVGARGRAARQVAALVAWLDHTCATAKAGKVKAAAQVEASATALARVWRGFAAHRAVEAVRGRRLGDTVAVLQRAVVHFLKRQRKPAATLAVRRWLRAAVAGHAARRGAATLVQTRWRRHCQRGLYLLVRRARAQLALKFVPAFRNRFARAASARAQARAIWRAEDAVAGARDFFLTREDEIKRQVLESTKVDDAELPAEAQVLFVHYASFGNKGNTTRLGVNSWSKLLKEAPGLLDGKHFTQPDGELIFTKSLAKLSRGGNESHLHYGDFLGALGRVAAAKYSRSDGSGRWGSRLQGDDGRLVRLLQEHLFQGAAAKKLFKGLSSQAAAGRADARIKGIVVKIQNGFRSHAARAVFLEKRRGLAGEWPRR
jgi:hypothetical protein